MSGALEIAAVGMRAHQRALDAIANNVSNMNTPAFKRSDIRFSELVDAAQVGSEASGIRGDALAGVQFRASPFVDGQGKLQPTGNPYDLAIDGAGFIELMGSAGRTLLWRGGTLRVLSDGVLATSGGLGLKANINVPEDATALRIDRRGQVFAKLGDSAKESELGSITLVKPADATSLERLDGGMYGLADGETVAEAGAGEEGMGYFAQSSLEQSNVDLNSEMIGLIMAQRAYGASAQVAKAADELHGIANGLRGS